MATKKKKRNPSYGFQKRIIIILIAFCVLAGAFFISPDNRNNLFSSFLTPPTSDAFLTTESSTTNPESTSDTPSTTEPSSTSDIPSTTEPETTNPASTTDCTAAPYNITARWNANPETNIANYKLMWGTTSGTYSNSANTNGPETSLQVGTFEYDTTYYFVVQAFNTSGNSSVLSDERSKNRPCPDEVEPPIIIIGGDTPPDPNKKPYPFIEKPDGEPEVTSTGSNIMATMSECPPPKILSLQYSTDLENWTDSGVPPYDMATVPPINPPLQGYDADTAIKKILERLAPIVPAQLFTRAVCTDSSAPSAPAASSSLGSSVLGTSQISDISTIGSEALLQKPSLWSRILLFFSSLFSSASLESDVLNTTPSKPSWDGIIPVNVSAEGNSSGDTITFNSTLLSGGFSRLDESSQIAVFRGTQLSIKAVTGPNSAFVRWEGCDSTVNTECFISVILERDVKAIFAPLQEYTLTTTKTGTGSGRIDGITGTVQPFAVGTSVTLTATPLAGSTFTGWSGDCSGTSACVVSMMGNKNVIATFTALPKYTLIATKSGAGVGHITSNIAGINCGTDCTEPYAQNTTITLTAKPVPLGSKFNGWSGACTGTGSCVVTMNAAKTVTATFVIIPTYTLTAAKTGTGTGTITSSVAGINCGNALYGNVPDCSETYNQNAVITLTAIPDAGISNTGWVGCTSVSGTTCTVSMNASKAVTATFNKPTYALAIKKAGTGTGTVLGTIGGSAGFSSGSFPSGSTIRIVATPATGSTFTGWSGCTSVSGTICTVTMTSIKTVTATFSLPSTYTVKINISGTGTGLVRWGTSGNGVTTGTTTTSKTLIIKRGATFQYTVEPYKGTANAVISGTCKSGCTINSNKTIDIKLMKI